MNVLLFSECFPTQECYHVTVTVDIFIDKYYFHRFEPNVIQQSSIVLNKLLSCTCDLIQFHGIDGSLCGVF